MSEKLVWSAKLIRIVALVTVCCSCTWLATQQGGVDRTRVALSPDVRLQLSASPAHLIGIEVSQLIRLQYAGEQHQLLSRLQFTESGITLVAISTQGVPLFEIVFLEGREPHVRQYLPIKGPEPQYILADIQLVLWPAPQLRSNLQGAELVEDADGKRRIILEQQQPLILIDRSERESRLEHLKRGYTVVISDIE